MRTLLLGAVFLGACSGQKTPLPAGAAAYQVVPAPSADQERDNYRIGPLDTLSVTVFQEPDLTSNAIQVDAAGNVLLPLIGEVRAGGQSSTTLADEIAKRLSEHYLTNPQVSVIVTASASQNVTVDGSVIAPGVYAIRGRTTLLDALALAHGTTVDAGLGNVAIFRLVNGKQVGGLFDVGKINRGLADDPEVIANDTVIVGQSAIKAAWHNMLVGAPLINAGVRAAKR